MAHKSVRKGYLVTHSGCSAMNMGDSENEKMVRSAESRFDGLRRDSRRDSRKGKGVLLKVQITFRMDEFCNVRVFNQPYV